MALPQQATTPNLSSLKPGRFVTLERTVAGGSLQARRLSTAVQFYWRFTANGRSDRIAIGPYDPKASPRLLSRQPGEGFSLLAASREAERLAHLQQANASAGGIRAQRDAEKASKVSVKERCLDKLLTDYCDHLKALERPSHREARSLFDVHVRKPWPRKAAAPACELTDEDIADILRRVVQQGKGRTANKLRSYLRAAYQTAKAARTKPSIPAGFKAFGIRVNPAADTLPDESQNRSAKNPLTVAELRSYWKILEKSNDRRAAFLRFHLCTGGQRIEQLVKLKSCDIGTEAIRLFDGKGRPGRPAREHGVPLIQPAIKALQSCRATGEYALSSDGGVTHIAATTLSYWAVQLVGSAIPGFQLKRVRSGVETALAASGVSADIRGRLQSHGISGVQARHYDGHDYLNEKRAALDLLLSALNRA
jgi:integrase